MSMTGRQTGAILQRLDIFLFRDLAYIVGGVSVILAFLYALNRIPATEPPLLFQIYVVLIGYVTGYAIQELLSIMQIVTTSYTKPNKIIRRLVAWFERTPSGELFELYDPVYVDIEEVKRCLDLHAPDEVKKRRDRLINLKHVGTTMGSNLLVVAFILAYKAFISMDGYDISLAVGALLLSTMLILTAWMKGYQQSRTEIRFHEDGCPEGCDGKAITLESSETGASG